MGSVRPVWQWAILGVASFAAALLLQKAGFSAALLVGPMLVGIVFGLRGATIRCPDWAFFAGQAIVGCLVARSMTADIVTTVIHDGPVMLLVVLSSIAAGGIVGWVLVKFGHLPGTTAAWGSTPGAANVMIAMAGEFGADRRLVAFMQYLRVILVTLSASFMSRLLLGWDHVMVAPPAVSAASQGVPLLSLLETLALAMGGAVLGRKFRIPAGGMLIPVVIGSVLQIGGLLVITLPQSLLAITYAALGWYVGLSFDRGVTVFALKAIPQLLMSSLGLIGLCGLSAWLLTWLLHVDALTAYLATSPGGLDSVTIIAVNSHADIPFVLAIQTLRVFVVIMTGPPLAKLISRLANPLPQLRAPVSATARDGR